MIFYIIKNLVFTEPLLTTLSTADVKNSIFSKLIEYHQRMVLFFKFNLVYSHIQLTSY